MGGDTFNPQEAEEGRLYTSEASLVYMVSPKKKTSAYIKDLATRTLAVLTHITAIIQRNRRESRTGRKGFCIDLKEEWKVIKGETVNDHPHKSAKHHPR